MLGQQTRSRQYRKKAASKKCKQGSPNPPALQEIMDCEGVKCSGDINDNFSGTKDVMLCAINI